MLRCRDVGGSNDGIEEAREFGCDLVMDDEPSCRSVRDVSKDIVVTLEG